MEIRRKRYDPRRRKRSKRRLIQWVLGGLILVVTLTVLFGLLDPAAPLYFVNHSMQLEFVAVWDVRLVVLSVGSNSSQLCHSIKVQCDVNPLWTHLRHSAVLSDWNPSIVPPRALIDGYEQVYAYSRSLRSLKRSLNESELQRTVLLVVPSDRALMMPGLDEPTLISRFRQIQSRFYYRRVVFSASKEIRPLRMSDKIRHFSNRTWKNHGIDEDSLQSGRIAPYLYSAAFMGFFEDVEQLVNMQLEVIEHPEFYPRLWRERGMVPSFRFESQQGLMQALFTHPCRQLGLPETLFPMHLRFVCSEDYGRGPIDNLVYPDFFTEIFKVIPEMKKDWDGTTNHSHPSVVIFEQSMIEPGMPFDSNHGHSVSSCGIRMDDPPRWLSLHTCLVSLAETTTNQQEKSLWFPNSEEEETVVSDDDDSNVHILPFPWQSSIWTRGGNFYHTMQCIWTGVRELMKQVKATKEKDPMTIAREWQSIRIAWTSRERSEENAKNWIAHEIARLFDGRFDSDQQLIDHYNRQPWKNYYLTSKQDNDGKEMDGRCRPNATDEVRVWLQLFFASKFKSQLIRYDQQKRHDNAPEYCKDYLQLNGMSVLIIGRKAHSRNFDGSKLALELRQSGQIRQVTYVRELSDLSLAKQSILFATHHFIVQPHGASGTGLMLSNSVSMNQGPPMINFELGPAYGHCAYPLNLTPDFFRTRLLSTTYGIVYEYPGLNCLEFDERVKFSLNQNMVNDRDLRFLFKDHYAHFAPDLNASLILRLLQEKLQSVMIPHCLGTDPNMNDSSPIAWTSYMSDSEHISDLRKAFKEANLGPLN